jgi:tetratricopeptide (TPR) repeat protein
VAEHIESLTDAVRWLKRSLRYLETADGQEATAWRARSLSFLAGVRNRQGRFADSARLCREAIVQAESVDELPALARACYALDWALFELGHADQATYSPRALSIYEQIGDPERESAVLNNLGMFAYFDDRWDDAIELYRKAGVCSERAGKPGDVAWTDCNVGEILSDQGHYAEATAHLERAKRVSTATGDRPLVAWVNVLLGRLAVRDGHTADGAALLTAAAADLRRFRLDAYADLAVAFAGEAEAFGGDPERALEIARASLQESDRNVSLLRRVIGIALYRLGDVEEAKLELLAALAAARERGSEYEAATTIHLLDEIGLADDDLRAERHAALERLHIAVLPSPVPASAPAGAGTAAGG